MNLRMILVLALSLGLTVEAQQVNIRGKISDASGKAIANAVLDLPLLKKKDTTGSDGAFAFNFIVTALRSLPESPSRDISMDRGILRLAVAEPSPVKIEIFDVKGNLLERKSMDKASAGVYNMDFGGKFPAENLLIVKASVGPDTKMFRHFPMARSGGKQDVFFGHSLPSSARLAKVAATVDTLKVSAAGFAPKSVIIASYDTTVNITLDSASDKWGGLKNPPGKSAGCGKATTVTNGKKTITSTNQQRTYIIDIPAGYDMNKPYRLFYCSHWIGSTSEAVRDQNYYFLKPLATAANDPAIFIAPQADGSTWLQKDHALFDDILAFATANLCIDTTRVFATGYSFGGMITYSLSTNHQKKIRAGAGIAPANYNIWLPNPKIKEPIAWMQTTGVAGNGGNGDETCPWINTRGQPNQGAKFIALEKAADNGCTLPADVPIWQNGNHLCYDFQGCKVGYPVKACTFPGGHTNIASDPGSNVNWIPQESWKFFTQF